MDKKQILFYNHHIEVTDILVNGDTLEQTIERVKDIQRRIDQLDITPKIASHRVKVEPYGYDGGVSVCIKCYRDETDEEADQRIEVERAAAEKQRRVIEAKQAKEYQQYLKLKAQFEKNEVA